MRLLYCTAVVHRCHTLQTTPVFKKYFGTAVHGVNGISSTMLCPCGSMYAGFTWFRQKSLRGTFTVEVLVRITSFPFPRHHTFT